MDEDRQEAKKESGKRRIEYYAEEQVHATHANPTALRQHPQNRRQDTAGTLLQETVWLHSLLHLAWQLLMHCAPLLNLQFAGANLRRSVHIGWGACIGKLDGERGFPYKAALAVHMRVSSLHTACFISKGLMRAMQPYLLQVLLSSSFAWA